MFKRIALIVGGSMIVLTIVHYGKPQLIQIINMIDSMARLFPMFR